MLIQQALEAVGESPREPWCLSFANTVSSRHVGGNDRLNTFEDLRNWLLKAGLLKEQIPGLEDARSLERAKRLREAIYHVGSAIASGEPLPREEIDELNWDAQKALMSLKLRSGGEALEWDLEALSQSVSGCIGLLALSAANLYTSSVANRVRECRNAECGWMFLDLSKNRSRKWCDMSDCGNLEKARRHYAKKKALATKQTGLKR